jgi:hypothetical protein
MQARTNGSFGARKEESCMFAVVLWLVGGVVAWLLVDQLLLWRNERQHRGPSAWREVGPDAKFHSTGFEETQPPHELVDLRYG